MENNDEACYFIQATVLRTSDSSDTAQHLIHDYLFNCHNSSSHQQSHTRLSIRIGIRVQNHPRRRFQELWEALGSRATTVMKPHSRLPLVGPSSCGRARALIIHCNWGMREGLPRKLRGHLRRPLGDETNKFPSIPLSLPKRLNPLTFICDFSINSTGSF